uniref:Mitochondrial ribosomal protein S18C n=1 Tax=Hucho hucho TaxID=62062 RepID=A0A4W5PXE0_9TELE
SPRPLRMENPYEQPQKGCILCDITVDFKNVQLLSVFINPHTGRIYSRHITSVVRNREISKAIKKAHSMGNMPFFLLGTSDDSRRGRFLQDVPPPLPSLPFLALGSV